MEFHFVANNRKYDLIEKYHDITREFDNACAYGERVSPVMCSQLRYNQLKIVKLHFSVLPDG